jgi:hypothetical protein
MKCLLKLSMTGRAHFEKWLDAAQFLAACGRLAGLRLPAALSNEDKRLFSTELPFNSDCGGDWTTIHHRLSRKFY